MTNTQTTSKVTFGELIPKESGIPTLEVMVDNAKGYLTPFRLYRFQVSGTIDGQNDLASSDLIEMRKLAKTSNGISVLETYAEFVVMKFGVRYSEHKMNELTYTEQTRLYAFVKQCAEWINTQN